MSTPKADHPEQTPVHVASAITRAGWPEGLPVQQVRIARPTDRLEEVVAFYRDGLGMPQIGGFDGHAGYRGVMLGLPDTNYHLEFTSHTDGSPGDAPTTDNLLVLYLGSDAAVRAVEERLRELGHAPVVAENPFWVEHGAVTIADPDGWRVVLMPAAGFSVG